MTTGQLQKIYAESQAYVRLNAYLQLAIAYLLAYFSRYLFVLED